MRYLPIFYYYIDVMPPNTLLETLPNALQKSLKSSFKYQSNSFRIYFKILSESSYHKFRHRTNEIDVAVMILTETIEYIEGETQNVINIKKFPYMIRQLARAIVDVSGQRLDKVSLDGDYLFKRLSEEHAIMHSKEGLLHRLIIDNIRILGIETYIEFRKLKTLDDKIAFAAAIEYATGINIEQRYKYFSSKGRPVKLSSDPHFSKQYENDQITKEKDISAELDSMSYLLTEKIKKDKEEYYKYGLKRVVNTKEENQGVLDN